MMNLISYNSNFTNYMIRDPKKLDICRSICKHRAVLALAWQMSGMPSSVA